CWQSVRNIDTGRARSKGMKMLIYILADDGLATLQSILAYGGDHGQPIGNIAQKTAASFCDPASNIIGLYQKRHTGVTQ
ncbi:MAG TPA: hypothetical protein VI758_08530, partial [Bacteroidota bacterium]